MSREQNRQFKASIFIGHLNQFIVDIFLSLSLLSFGRITEFICQRKAQKRTKTFKLNLKFEEINPKKMFALFFPNQQIMFNAKHI